MRHIFRHRRRLGQRAVVRRSVLAITLACAVFWLPPAGALALNSAASPDYSFSLPCLTSDGDMRFADLAASGKPFMLVWWKSDCPHCLRELPFVQQLAELAAAGKLDLTVVSINVDKSTDACLALADKRKLSFPILSDPDARKTDSQFDVWQGDGLPCTWLFGPGGACAGCLHSDQSDYVDQVLSKLGLVIDTHDKRWDPIAAALGQRVQYRIENRGAWLLYDKFVAPRLAAATAASAASVAAQPATPALKLGHLRSSAAPGG